MIPCNQFVPCAHVRTHNYRRPHTPTCLQIVVQRKASLAARPLARNYHCAMKSSHNSKQIAHTRTHVHFIHNHTKQSHVHLHTLPLRRATCTCTNVHELWQHARSRAFTHICFAEWVRGILCTRKCTHNWTNSSQKLVSFFFVTTNIIKALCYEVEVLRSVSDQERVCVRARCMWM